MNVMKIFLMLSCCMMTNTLLWAQVVVHGLVEDAINGKAIDQASIWLRGTRQGTRTDANGFFRLVINNQERMLVISHLGYLDQVIEIGDGMQDTLRVKLEPAISELAAVEINTGYQLLPKERATGSFVQLDNSLLNRRVSTDILSRIEDVTPGLIFDRGPIASGNPPITIRGQSTINAKTEPLIVIDNFPYEGDFNTINPNDVESITILKDAAAASIWGARAGNGVIVITTKRGGFNRKTNVSFNTNITVAAKPDQFYQPKISTADYIEVEKLLFARGYYTDAEQSLNNYALTPVVEMLIAGGKEAEIEQLKWQDVRNDYDRFLNRNAFNRQYAINLNGGSENQRFYFSAGYDRNLETLVGNAYRRVSLNAKNTYLFFDKRLELTSDIYFSESGRETNGFSSVNMTSAYGSQIDLYPYARLSDGQGNHLAVVKDYRMSFVDNALRDGLLDWQYRPLDELSFADNSSRITDYRINSNLNYKFSKAISLSAFYQYAKTATDQRNLQPQEAYAVRNLINRYSIVRTAGVERPIPLGGILDQTASQQKTHSLRLQLNAAHKWNDEHEINGLAGVEMRDQGTVVGVHRLYGYNDEYATSAAVDYTGSYTSYVNPGQTNLRIPNVDSQRELTDRFLSYYSNLSYTLRNKYTLSASGRLDQSNLFGVETNNKGVPLYSVGLSWLLSDEDFYWFKSVPYLKLRATFGYNGNIDKSMSAFVTARYSSNDPNTRLPYATILNPPNPDLRWERVRVVNLGLDFGTANNRLNGSIEYFKKDGMDLIGVRPYAPSSGIVSFTGNYADTKGDGLDLVINAQILDRKLKWDNNLLFSAIGEKVTNYKQSFSVASYLDDYIIAPMEGRPLSAIYAYQWAGLDASTGDPLGVLNGEPSQDYSAILAAATPQNLVYLGAGRPRLFGAFRNTFSYGAWSISVNISYRFKYYFRRASIDYNALLLGYGGHGDYENRWRQAGDEQFTQVPSMPDEPIQSRNTFYTNSAILVDKADHIRLQDINLSYRLTKATMPRLPVSSAQLYVYANNIGILWKATNTKLDPDYARVASPPMRTIALGVKIDF